MSAMDIQKAARGLTVKAMAEFVESFAGKLFRNFRAIFAPNFVPFRAARFHFVQMPDKQNNPCERIEIA